MSKEQKRQAFYTQSPEEVLKSVEATEQGLSSSEAQKRKLNMDAMNWKRVRKNLSWLNSLNSLRI